MIGTCITVVRTVPETSNIKKLVILSSTIFRRILGSKVLFYQKYFVNIFGVPFLCPYPKFGIYLMNCMML